MFPWWPKTIPTELIPVFRTLGRKAYYGEVTTRTDLPACLSNATRHLLFTSQLSLKENDLLQHLEADVVYMLGKVLADGVKLFEIPANFEALNEIEIPLLVKDYCQPFPAVVVKSGDEYHFVVHDHPTLTIGTLSNSFFDWSNMLTPDRSIDSYLDDSLVISSAPDSDLKAVVNDPGAFKHHRWRATLNFLLLSMVEGIDQQPATKIPKQLKRHPIARLAVPRLYQPQNIALLKSQYSAAVRPEGVASETTGSARRPHWRRAHWRNQPCGVGGKDRKPTLIKAMFIHRELVGSLDRTHSTYKIEPKRAADLMLPIPHGGVSAH